MPVVSIALGSALALVVFGLLQAQDNSIRDFIPILELDTASYDRQACRPVFFWSASILLGDGEIVQ